MSDRLEEVLDTVAQSKNCPKRWKDIFTCIIALNDKLEAMDYNDFEDLFRNDEDFIDLIKNTLGIDVSDLSDQNETPVEGGTGTGRRTVWYIGTYPDRELFRTDGFQTNGFASEEEAQAALDEIYESEYYRKKYPGLRVLSRVAWNVYHD